MSQYYYTNQNNEVLGPCAWEHIEKLAQEGTIMPSTMISLAGENRWRPLSEWVPPANSPSPGSTIPTQTDATLPTQTSAEVTPPPRSKLATTLYTSWEVAKKLATDPVGKLPAAARDLGNAGAQSVGITFGVVFMASFLLTANFHEIGRELIRKNLINWIVASAVPFACFWAMTSLTRVIFRGAGALGTDSLIAGVAVLPFAVLIPLGALLGVANVEIISALGVFSLCTCLLLLYTGCLGVNQLSTRAALLALPMILLGSVWLAKIILAALLKDLPKSF